MPFQDVKDRMLFVEALETAKCFEEGVIESAAAANIGSIMGIGFPAITGGAAQFMQGYEQSPRPDRVGLGASSRAPTSSPSSTASGSAPRRTCATWPRPGALSRPDRRVVGFTGQPVNPTDTPRRRRVGRGPGQPVKPVTDVVQRPLNQGWCRS